MGNNMFAYCNNSPVNFSDPAGNMMVNISNGADDVKRLYVGPALNHSDTSFGSLIGNAIGSLWEGACSVVEACGDFIEDRFSTPEKASNTLTGIGIALDAGSAYTGMIAVNFSVPTGGISAATAGVVSVSLAAASIPFYAAAWLIDVFNEE